MAITSGPSFPAVVSQRRRQGRRSGAAGLRHVGLAAALAADLLGDEVDQLAGLDLAGQVGGDARRSGTLPSHTLASTMAAVLSLSLSLSSVSRRVLARRRLPAWRPAP
jgi:hypothetical protein